MRGGRGRGRVEEEEEVGVREWDDDCSVVEVLHSYIYIELSNM